jgi:hypothetical protein
VSKQRIDPEIRHKIRHKRTTKALRTTIEPARPTLLLGYRYGPTRASRSSTIPIRAKTHPVASIGVERRFRVLPDQPLDRVRTVSWLLLAQDFPDQESWEAPV